MNELHKDVRVFATSDIHGRLEWLDRKTTCASQHALRDIFQLARSSKTIVRKEGGMIRLQPRIPTVQALGVCQETYAIAYPPRTVRISNKSIIVDPLLIVGHKVL